MASDIDTDNSEFEPWYITELESRCGVCTETIERETPVVVLIGCRNRMVYLGRTGTIPFPKTHVDEVDAYLDEKTKVNLCYPCSLVHMENRGRFGWIEEGCPEHGTDPDRNHVGTAVHKDCFVIAQQTCPLAPRLTCERIWELAVARNPWPHGFQPPKSLSLKSPYLTSPQAVNQVASIFDIPQLRNAPSELVERIRSYSPGSTPFWRAVAALTVASSLPEIPMFAEQRVKLRHILHWKRGERIATVGPKGQDDVLLLTFDVDGIREIERFSQTAQCAERHKSCPNLAYVLLGTKPDELALDKKHGEFSRRMAYCRNGLLRLAVDADDVPFLPRIWNAPTPPDLTDCTYLYHKEMYRVSSTGCYISLDSVSGLTFVYRGHQLVAIHPHRGDEVEMNSPKIFTPSLSMTQEACFFLPVTKEDAILGIAVGGAQNALFVVVRKRLSGETVIGLPCPDVQRDDRSWRGPYENEGDFYKRDELMWSERNPIALVYGIRGKKNYVDMLGGYRGTPSTKPEGEGWTSSILHLWPHDLFSLGDEQDLRFYTHAPLRGVVAAQMFFYSSNPKRPKRRICSGVILHYENGGSRVVGEIRLEDCSKLAGEMVIKPKFICLRSGLFPGDDTPYIHFVSEADIAIGGP